MEQKFFITYIMSSHNLTLYVGVTNNILRRIYEHKEKINPKSFTSKYNVNKLVYYECFEQSMLAIIREKQIKKMNRDEKIELIRSKNNKFIDLYNEIKEILV